jgi:hypothetical protein
MGSEPSNPVEIVNGRRIKGYSWGWTLEFQHIRLKKFPDQPLITFRRFDSLELAREMANKLGPIVEIDESECAARS